MSHRVTLLSDLLSHGYDEVIDVRSPSEFAEDHVPGALNLPVLDDAERAQVGTIYVQDDPFRARKIGAALIARNAAAHLEGPLADRPGGWRPLLYCWRGGQRSGSFATILRQIGWRAETVEGGYRSWRRAVVEALYHRPWPARVILLDGYTGTGKSAVLHRVAALGGQVLDLEALAGHRGSLFGAVGPQPSQKAFETALAVASARLDPARPLIVEAESSKIGACLVPPALWKAMRAAPRIAVEAPLAARAEFTLGAYADLTADRDRLTDTIASLRRLCGGEAVARWQALARAGEDRRLVAELMEVHYDPRYARSRRPAAVTLRAARLDPPDLDALAAGVLEAAARLGTPAFAAS